jgi:hypothetical protein
MARIADARVITARANLPVDRRLDGTVHPW